MVWTNIVMVILIVHDLLVVDENMKYTACSCDVEWSLFCVQWESHSGAHYIHCSLYWVVGSYWLDSMTIKDGVLFGCISVVMLRAETIYD
jgi:hypothetical protein